MAVTSGSTAGGIRYPVGGVDIFDPAAALQEIAESVDNARDADMETVKQLIAALPHPYPVGAIYISVTNTNPASLFPGTTWVAWGTGRVPVGVDTTQNEFASVEQTGGQKAVTLTAAQSGVGPHTHESKLITEMPVVVGEPGSGGTTGSLLNATNYNGMVFNYQVTGTITETSANAKESHSIVQPYITCFMWKRTA
jgi:hypothetical protein